MATAAAGNSVDDFADLELAGAEARLAAVEAARLARHTLPVIPDSALGPPAEPPPASWRVCRCDRPRPDGDDELPTCFTCGRSIATAAVPSVETAATPWSTEQVDELRELVRAGAGKTWATGDLLLAMVPMGTNRQPSGALTALAELARRVGLEQGRAKQLRTVSHAWPSRSRVDGASWNAHSAFTRGGPKAAPERARLLARLRDEHGTVTADDVRRARGRPEHRPPVDPFRSALNKVDALHRAIVKLPAERPRNGHASVALLLRRAEQAREIADQLERLAA